MGRGCGSFSDDEEEPGQFHTWMSERNSTASTPEATAIDDIENEEDAVVVNIEDDELNAWDEHLRDELQKHMYQTPSREEPIITIPRVPQRLRYGSDEPYDPRIISIGPYHLDKNNLKTMEKHKWQYLGAILSRNTNVTLKDYIREIKALEVRAKKCYSGEFYLEREMFVQTMLLDGCFIVEYLLIKKAGEHNHLGGMIWMEELLLRDLLLLENQLPFFVLQRIFYLATRGKAISSSLVEVAINFFNKKFFTKRTGLPREPIHHLLHLYHWFLLSIPVPLEPIPPSLGPFGRFKLSCMKHLVSFRALVSTKQKHSTAEMTVTNMEGNINMIPNAMVLQEAGIKFKKREVKGGSILDVKFSDEVTEIPPLLIDAFTKTQFRNLIAFEQFYPNTEAKFTSYIIFLDNIVDTPEDVAFLHRSGIIEHMFGSDEVAASIFNELIKGTFSRPKNYLSDLYREVDKYHRARRHRWWASFVRKYLNSPLKILSMVAAIIFLVLSFLQTFFSVYSYFHPPS